MSNLIHADIFFFITSIAVVILTILLLIAVYFSFRIFKKTESFVDDIKREGQKVISDVDDLRNAIREEGSKIKYMSEILSSFLVKKEKSRTKKKAKNSQEEENV